MSSHQQNLDVTGQSGEERRRMELGLTVDPIECAAITTFLSCLALHTDNHLRTRSEENKGTYLKPSIVPLSLEKYPSRSSRL